MLKDNMWAGQRCFLVGGGPSLKDFDWNLLKNELWIGINAAWIYAVPTISLTQDQRCLRLFSKPPYRERWYKLPCKVHKWPHQVKGNENYKDVIPLNKAPNKTWGKTLEHGIYPASNAGLSALNLAEILGADPIYLLGFDMKKSNDGENHFHDKYRDSWKQPAKVYEHFARDFSKICCYLKSKVINLSPDSALDCFVKQNLKDIFKKSEKS